MPAPADVATPVSHRPGAGVRGTKRGAGPPRLDEDLVDDDGRRRVREVRHVALDLRGVRPDARLVVLDRVEHEVPGRDEGGRLARSAAADAAVDADALQRVAQAVLDERMCVCT